MTEILTESFCERCGTRYTFESVAPRQRRIGGIKVLGKGLKNFVMSDDSSLDEAMAAARSDVEREATAQQLDAFHRTFNFCMSCRQYTCGNCWNHSEARCLSCAPMAVAEGAEQALDVGPSMERLLQFTGAPAEAMPEEVTAAPETLGAEGVEISAWASPETHPGEAVEISAWAAPATPPAEAVPDAAATGAAPAQEPTDELGLEAILARSGAAPQPPGAGAPAAAEPEAAAPDLAEPGAVQGAPGEGVPGEAAAEAGLVGLEPGESLDAAIAAYEAAQAQTGAAAGGPGVDIVSQPVWPPAGIPAVPGDTAPAEAAAVESPAAEPAAEPAAVEPAAAEPAAPFGAPGEAAPSAIEPAATVAPQVPAEIGPAAEPSAAAMPGAEPAAVPATPEAEPLPQAASPAAPSPLLPPAPEVPSGPPQWPTGPRWPTGVPARQPTEAPPLTTPAADPLAAIMARQATEAMWAASSRDVVQAPLVAQVAPTAAVQPCVSCGISLSATARFCRRCGTPQSPA